MAPADRSGSNGDADPRVGLCATCQHGRRVDSSRRTTYWRCRLADKDQRFPKYPVLPVVRCSGFSQGTP